MQSDMQIAATDGFPALPCAGLQPCNWIRTQANQG